MYVIDRCHYEPMTASCKTLIFIMKVNQSFNFAGFKNKSSFSE